MEWVKRNNIDQNYGMTKTIVCHNNGCRRCSGHLHEICHDLNFDITRLSCGSWMKDWHFKYVLRSAGGTLVMWLTYNATTLPMDLGQILHQAQVWAKLVDHDILQIMHSTCLHKNPNKWTKRLYLWCQREWFLSSIDQNLQLGTMTITSLISHLWQSKCMWY